MDAEALRELVRRALDEDEARADVTTEATVPAGLLGRAALVARQRCVVAGLEAFTATFTELDGSLAVTVIVRDGAEAGPGEAIAEVEGPLRPILSAERTALNFVQRLSGIATLTRRFVEAAAPVPVLDTRKTTPGLRELEKAAVRAGGGRNHRSSLSDSILIKDNHLVAAGGVATAVAAAGRTGLPVEVECDTLEQVSEALDAGAEHLLLDNMELEQLEEAVRMTRGRARVEASGGVTLDTIGAVAATGVDEISVGALSHSAPSADLSLEVTVL